MSARGYYECRLVNGLAGDPAIYVFSPASGDALFLDLGCLQEMPPKELLRAKIALVSHTHIDHFIGFDRWLRVNVPHHRELAVVGPVGMAGNVAGKLKGYTWNLIAPDQVRFRVWEVSACNQARCFLLTPEAGFDPVALPTPEASCSADPGALSEPNSLGGFRTSAMVTELSDGGQVLAVPLDHGTPSVAYAIKTPLYFEVDVAAMQQRGLVAGPWLGALQKMAAAGNLETSLDVAGVSYPAADLAAAILRPRDKKPLGYVTDIEFTKANLERAYPVLAGVERLYCESHFAAADAQRAHDKKHLTAKQAALLAVFVGAQELIPFHISSIYYGFEQQVVDEAQHYFHEFRQLSSDQLAFLIEQECAGLP